MVSREVHVTLYTHLRLLTFSLYWCSFRVNPANKKDESYEKKYARIF